MSSAPRHEVLQDAPGKRMCLLGNVAIVRGALEAGVQMFACYPGTPSSEVGDTLSRIAKEADIQFEYSVNEKIAVEVAFAACLTGARSMCSMKHVGFNSANDPISTMPYVGVEGGMVIVSAGDPSTASSSTEQDQRHFTRFAHYPVFDPATPKDALAMTRFAFSLSEQVRLPVIMRPTTRVCHGSGVVEFGPLPKTRNAVKFTKNPSRYVPIPINNRRMRKEITERYRHAEQMLASSPFFPRSGTGRRGIVASGVAYAYASQIVEQLQLHDEVMLQQIGAYPIPDGLLVDFIHQVDSVLVLEELTPFVEDWVSLCAFRHGRQISVRGKNTGHLPVEYEYSPDLVEDAIRDYLGYEPRQVVVTTVADLPARPPVLCPGCPHRTSYYLANKVFGKKTVYCNDIGCYTLGYGDPFHACDMLLCMGSSISQASGVSRMTGERVVACIGDSTFFHSGLPALANAQRANDNITVLVLDNYVTAMTGCQPSLTTGADQRPPPPKDDADPPPFSIEDAVRGLGVTQVESVNVFDEEKTLEAFRQAKNGTGVHVVICQSPCVVNENRLRRSDKRASFEVDQALCNSCSLCVRMLGCPAILIVDGEYTIDENLCDGCALCAEVCNRDAIKACGSVELDRTDGGAGCHTRANCGRES